ncbi:MAG: outer membrane protein assembly factor BamE [Pseudomonadota bacterium]
MLTLTGGLFLAGCGALMPALPAPGASVDAVTAAWGKPSAVYPDGPDRVLEYATGPMGQNTWMARIGPDGRVLSFEQVLTSEKFATIGIGTSTREQVLRTLGRPAERSQVAMRNYEVWSYRYKESGVWNSMMHVHFDTAGVVQMMQNGPDPMYEYNDALRD